ncbi:MAG: response regulator [Caldilineaceae bacterium]
MNVPSDDPEKKRILIVEDDPLHMKLLKDELIDEYELDFAGDSQSALDYLNEESAPSYNMVIIDLRLPRNLGELPLPDEGFRILDALHEQPQLSPTILVVSGNLIERTKKRAQAYGVKQIFEKPFSLKTLRKYIDLLAGSGNDIAERELSMVA